VSRHGPSQPWICWVAAALLGAGVNSAAADEFLARFQEPFLVGDRDGSTGADDWTERELYVLRHNGRPLLIGRRANVDLRVKRPRVSGHHAQLLPPSTRGGTGIVATEER